MVYHPVAEITAFFRRNDLPQFLFDFCRFLNAVHQADAVAQPDAVGVSHDGRLAEHIPHNQVGAFAAHTGQAQQRVKVAGHFAAVFIPQLAHTGRNIPRLAAPQAAGFYNGFDFFRFGRCQRFHTGISGKQVLHHHVYTGVGALCRQPYRHQQLPGVVIIQRTF